MEQVRGEAEQRKSGGWDTAMTGCAIKHNY